MMPAARLSVASDKCDCVPQSRTNLTTTWIIDKATTQRTCCELRAGAPCGPGPDPASAQLRGRTHPGPLQELSTAAPARKPSGGARATAHVLLPDYPSTRTNPNRASGLGSGSSMGLSRGQLAFSSCPQSWRPCFPTGVRRGARHPPPPPSPSAANTM